MRINEATSVEPVVAGIFAISGGRLGSVAAGVVGLIGIAISARALSRSTGSTRSDTDVGVAMVFGLIGIVVGGSIVASADGGLGSGSGLGGAIVAMVLGLIAIVLGGMARVRRREVA